MTLISPTPIRQLAVWRNGGASTTRMRPTVPVTDHGLVVGDGVFEALKATPAGAFAVQRHLNRLSRSAAAHGSARLPTTDWSERGSPQRWTGGRCPRAKVRVTHTGGEGPLGSGAAYGPPTLIVAVEPRRPGPRRPRPSSPRRGGATRTAR